MVVPLNMTPLGGGKVPDLHRSPMILKGHLKKTLVTSGHEDFPAEIFILSSYYYKVFIRLFCAIFRSFEVTIGNALIM